MQMIGGMSNQHDRLPQIMREFPQPDHHFMIRIRIKPAGQFIQKKECRIAN